MKAKRVMKLFLILSLITYSFHGMSQIKILSGLQEGTYNELALNIKNITDIPIEVLTSGGSLNNYKLLIEDNNINITFLQYDVLLINELLNSKIKEDIKILFPLFLDEEIHLIARNDDTINTLKDLEGKKVAIGTVLQGTNVTSKMIKRVTGIKWTDVEIGFNDAFKALNNNEIDALFYVGGAPISQLQSLAYGVEDKIKLVPLKHKKLGEMYTKKRIKAFSYNWLNYNVETYAVTTLLVINAKDNIDITYDEAEQLYDAIKQNMPKLISEGHPKWKNVYNDSENTKVDWSYFYTPPTPTE